MIKFESSVYSRISAKKETLFAVDFLSASRFCIQEKTSVHQTFLNNYLMIYISAGRLTLFIDGDREELTAGNLAIISPFTSYKGIVDPASSADKCAAEFYLVEFNCSNFAFFPLRKYTVLSGANAAESALDELYSRYERYKSDAYIFDVLLLETIYVAEKLAKKTTPQQQLAERVQEYILQNTTRVLTVDELADKFGYNKQYLGRVFKAEYGSTIKDYINSRKMALAKKFLATSDMPVAAVGQFLGWQDLNQFLKYFKYHEGVTPSQYRSSAGE
ncbi:MAG: helix-turn-helix transcriptional regulator [Clostridia bacterium]|nr:helix-turn-helix transcriptional regulator [Clostridia bacterium]